MDMQITALEDNPARSRPRSGSCGRADPEGGAAEKLAPISQQIWDAKYRLKADDGTPIDVTVEDSWRRVARALAAAEKRPEQWEVPSTRPSRIFAYCRRAGSWPAPAPGGE